MGKVRLGDSADEARAGLLGGALDDSRGEQTRRNLGVAAGECGAPVEVRLAIVRARGGGAKKRGSSNERRSSPCAHTCASLRREERACTPRQH